MENSTSPTDFADSLRLNSNELTRLQERARLALARGSSQWKARGEPRIPFQSRELIGIAAQQPGGTVVRVRVSATDISETGLGIIAGSYLHPTCKVDIHVCSLDGSWWKIEGEVVWCVHSEGRFHVAGIKFAERINVRQFVTREEYARAAAEQSESSVKITGTVLVLCDQPIEQALLTAVLAETGAKVSAAATVAEAVAIVNAQNVQAAVVDLDLVNETGAQALAELRRAGFTGPAIAVSARSAAKRGKIDSDVDVLTKPYKPRLLAQMVSDGICEQLGAGGGEPIDCTLDAKSPYFPCVGRFVESVKAEAQKLQQSIDSGDLERAQTTCRALLTGGKPFGYAAIADAAQRAILALDASQSVAESAPSLRQLCAKIALMRVPAASTPPMDAATAGAAAAPAAAPAMAPSAGHAPQANSTKAA